MSCSNCGLGPFDNSTLHQQWQNTSINTANGVSIQVNLNTASPSPGLTVSKGGSSQFFPLPSNGGTLKYMQWGTTQTFVAVLSIEGGVGSLQRTVVLVNTTGASVTVSSPVIFISEPSSVPLPFIDFCMGDGSIILIGSPDDFTPNQFNNLQFLKADTAAVLLSAGTHSAIPQLSGNITTTQIQLLGGTTVLASAPLPLGHSSVSPSTLSFPDAVIGAGVNPALASSTRQVTISNTGNNCMTVSGFTNAAHYSFVTGSNSKPLPVVLQPGDNFHIDVLFNPGVIGTFTETIAINPVPQQGDTVIHCTGHARVPHITLTYNTPLNFGNVPLGSTASRNLTITNNGEADVTVTIPPPTAGSPYQWTSPGSVVIHTGSSTTLAITYTPTAEGSDPRTFTFTSNATGSPHTVSLVGSGCVANAVIHLPNTGPIDLGSVQRGFRTVRMFRVQNTGDAALIFNARIVPAAPANPASVAAAALYGLLQDNTTPVTSPFTVFPASISINPVTACGSLATGSGEFIFGVTFFANDVPGTVNANLEIFGHNDTTPGTPPVFSISLTAAITSPVAVDAELVIDHSGSMSDSSGSRTKIETARDAAKLFVQLSRPDVGDRVGLVKFNDVPEVVSSITDITTANQTALAGTINAANFSPSGFTCIAGGVLVAENDADTHPRATPISPLNKIVLVMTDGIDNTSYLNPGDGITYSLLGGNGTTALPIPTDKKIYAIGIGDDIDTGRLGQLATSTGGTFLQAREFSGADYFSLEKHFTQVYMEAVNYATISDPVFEINPGETQYFEFEVLNGDKSAMVVIYDKDDIRIPFFITSPSGEMIDMLTIPAGYQVRPGISPTARFIEVIMPQGEPQRYAGTWKVQVKHDGRACRYGTPSFNQKIGNFAAWQGSFDAEQFGPGFQPTTCKVSGDPILYGIALGVSSNFSMIAFVTPGIVNVGEPILLTGMLSEYGLPVTGGTINITAIKPDGTVTYHTLYDDGNHLDDQSNDGTYGFNYPYTTMAGTYSFTFSSTATARDGKQVKRELVRSKYVQGNEPLVPVTTPGVTGGGTGSNECCTRVQLYLRIFLWIMVLIFIVLILILLKK